MNNQDNEKVFQKRNINWGIRTSTNSPQSIEK